MDISFKLGRWRLRELTWNGLHLLGRLEDFSDISECHPRMQLTGALSLPYSHIPRQVTLLYASLPLFAEGGVSHSTWAAMLGLENRALCMRKQKDMTNSKYWYWSQVESLPVWLPSSWIEQIPFSEASEARSGVSLEASCPPEWRSRQCLQMNLTPGACWAWGYSPLPITVCQRNDQILLPVGNGTCLLSQSLSLTTPIPYF